MVTDRAMALSGVPEESPVDEKAVLEARIRTMELQIQTLEAYIHQLLARTGSWGDPNQVHADIYSDGPTPHGDAHADLAHADVAHGDIFATGALSGHGDTAHADAVHADSHADYGSK